MEGKKKQNKKATATTTLTTESAGKPSLLSGAQQPQGDRHISPQRGGAPLSPPVPLCPPLSLRATLPSLPRAGSKFAAQTRAGERRDLFTQRLNRRQEESGP